MRWLFAIVVGMVQGGWNDILYLWQGLPFTPAQRGFILVAVALEFLFCLAISWGSWYGTPIMLIIYALAVLIALKLCYRYREYIRLFLEERE